jgi:hypothetical protein
LLIWAYGWAPALIRITDLTTTAHDQQFPICPHATRPAFDRRLLDVQGDVRQRANRSHLIGNRSCRQATLCPLAQADRAVEGEAHRCPAVDHLLIADRPSVGVVGAVLAAVIKEWDANNFPRFPAAANALWQGLPTLPPGRLKVSEPNVRPETFGWADGGVGRPAPSARFPAAANALWQGLPTLPPGRLKVSEPNVRPETFGRADGGVGRPAPSARG